MLLFGRFRLDDETMENLRAAVQRHLDRRIDEMTRGSTGVAKPSALGPDL